MKRFGLIASVLFLPTLGMAFETPRVFFEDYKLPFFDTDTVYQSMDMVYEYAKDPDFDSSIVPFMVEAGWTEDAKSGTLRMSERLIAVVEVDGNNRMSAAENHSLPNPSSNDGRTELTWNAGGKPVLEVSTNFEDETMVDSTIYTWTHPNCPDTRLTYSDASDEKLVWSVDGQGRCLTAADSTWSDFFEEWSFNSTLSRVWGASGPVQETTVDDWGDTTSIQRIAYLGVGLPKSDSTWKVDMDGATLGEVCVNNYVASAFHDRQCVTTEGFYSIAYSMNLTSTTGVSYRAARARIPVQASALPGRVQFHNASTERIELDVRSVSGARLGSIVLDADATTSIPTTTGSVVWKARSATATTSGLLNTVR